MAVAKYYGFGRCSFFSTEKEGKKKKLKKNRKKTEKTRAGKISPGPTPPPDRKNQKKLFFFYQKKVFSVFVFCRGAVLGLNAPLQLRLQLRSTVSKVPEGHHARGTTLGEAL